MLLLILFGILTAILVVVQIKTDSLCSFTFMLVSSAVFVMVGLVALLKNFPGNAHLEQTKAEERYAAITYAVAQERADILTVSESIANYNADVLNGRYMFHNPWTSCFSYAFWDDMPLIELE